MVRFLLIENDFTKRTSNNLVIAIAGYVCHLRDSTADNVDISNLQLCSIWKN
jgi:hypothetical protein